MADDLTAFLTGRYDTEEHAARFATRYNSGTWTLMASCTIDMGTRRDTDGDTWGGVFATDSDPGAAQHILDWQPARVLRTVAAKRHRLDLHRPRGGTCPACAVPGPCETLLTDAAEYEGAPGWRETWRLPELVSRPNVVVAGEVVRRAAQLPAVVTDERVPSGTLLLSTPGHVVAYQQDTGTAAEMRRDEHGQWGDPTPLNLEVD